MAGEPRGGALGWKSWGMDSLGDPINESRVESEGLSENRLIAVGLSGYSSTYLKWGYIRGFVRWEDAQTESREPRGNLMSIPINRRR